jgi:hypothetical protein
VSGQQHAPAVLYPRERPGTHCTGGWVGPRVGLDRGLDPRTVQPVAQSLYRLSYPAHVYCHRHTILRTVLSDIEASCVQFCCCNSFITVYTNLNVCDSVTYIVTGYRQFCEYSAVLCDLQFSQLKFPWRLWSDWSKSLDIKSLIL